jgi:hypothetical protein
VVFFGFYVRITPSPVLSMSPNTILISLHLIKLTAAVNKELNMPWLSWLAAGL